jgi:vitamin B12 transporter
MSFIRLFLPVSGALCLAAASTLAQPKNDAVLPEVVVTATGRPEEVSKIAGTIQVINQDRIAHSNAKSVTDLLAENAVGFMSEWTAGQTSLNIRGGATEGQGRDFKSEVLVLINGHRAGTANISKLSIADVERIEIVRGPSSVVYGSQNMGGVVNVILKTGKTAPGNVLEGEAGAWSFFQGHGQAGGQVGRFDYYVGAEAGGRDNYQVGGGAGELNTGWSRFGATGAFGIQLNGNNRLDLTVRSDGIYKAGFRGSSANMWAYDTRYNRSFDMTYTGKTPDNHYNLYWQLYYVQDVDDLNNPAPLSNLNAVAARTLWDRNRRELDIMGQRFQPQAQLWEGNKLLLGFDWELTVMRNERYRQGPGNAFFAQVSPQDNNETDSVSSFYAEDRQSLFGDRVTLSAGIRQTWGQTQIDPTQNAFTLVQSKTPYTATTYSAGATWHVTDWMNARVGSSSGFRAPTATELGANFTVTPIGTTIFGNPNVLPETSQQFEVGSTFYWDTAGRVDLALFSNTIRNRILPQTISSVGGVVIQQQQNSPGDLLVQGVEVQAEADALRTFDIPAGNWQWKLFANGFYNFMMTDYGAQWPAGTQQAVRVLQYELSLGTRFGQATDVKYPWNWQVLGLLRGPMWYNTEEALSPIFFPNQVRTVTIYRKDAFWVWNTRAEVEVLPGFKVFGMINNIFDINQSPIFIATDTVPCGANPWAQNGSCGNSMPGREWVVGAQVKF